MGDVVNIDTRQKEREAQSREQMLKVLGDAMIRVRENITVGIVLCEASASEVHYHSGAGKCCSHTMLGLLTASSFDIADRINERSEDVTDGEDEDEDDAG